jgi:hypothetical protein
MLELFISLEIPEDKETEDCAFVLTANKLKIKKQMKEW